MTGEKKIWFPAKTHGWGWGPPVCWQGWVVLIVYSVLLIVGTILFVEQIVHLLLYTFALSGLLIRTCWRTGETPKWRWGGK